MSNGQDFQRPECRIKRRKIQHDQIYKTAQNKGCPKFILGTCWMDNQEIITSLCQDNAEKQIISASFKMVDSWILQSTRDKLGLIHLNGLFGIGDHQFETKRNYINAKAFYRFLSREGSSIILNSKKVTKCLSYHICIEKYSSRLGNAKLVNKVQFK